MVAASQEYEPASDLRLGTDNSLPFQEEGSRQRAVKLSAVAIRARIDGIQDSHLQDGSLGQRVQCISGRWIKTGLQVKIQNSSCGDSNGRGDCILTRSGTHKQTDETQNRNHGTMHEPGLSTLEKRDSTMILGLPERHRQRETRQ